MLSDEQLAQSRLALGKKQLNAGDYGDAVKTLEQGLEYAVKAYGELHLDSAPFYYFFGDAILAKLETSSDALAEGMGNDSMENDDDDDDDAAADDDDAAAPKAAGAGAEGDNEDGDTADGENNKGVNVDEDIGEVVGGEFQACWEVLEVARVIYANALSTDPANEKIRKDLVRVYCRLGDLSKEQEDTNNAKSDYQEALNHLQQLPNELRMVADCHFSLGIVLEYAATAPPPQNRDHPADAPPPEPPLTPVQRLERMLQAKHHLELSLVTFKKIIDNAAQSIGLGQGKAPASEEASQAMEKAKAEIADFTSICEEIALKLEEINQFIGRIPASITAGVAAGLPSAGAAAAAAAISAGSPAGNSNLSAAAADALPIQKSFAVQNTVKMLHGSTTANATPASSAQQPQQETSTGFDSPSAQAAKPMNLGVIVGKRKRNATEENGPKGAPAKQ